MKRKKTKTQNSLVVRTLMRTSPFCGGAMMTSVTSRGLLASHATAARHSIGCFLFLGFQGKKRSKNDRRLRVVGALAQCSPLFVPLFSF